MFELVVRVVVFGFGLICVAFACWWFFVAATQDRAKVANAPSLVRLWVIGLPTAFALSGGLFVAAALVPDHQEPLVIVALGVWLVRELGTRLTARRMVEEATGDVDL